MKSIIVKNIKIQFDSFDEGADKHNALNMMDEINSLLQERFPDAQPQIFVGEITEDDIEIADDESEDNPTHHCPNCTWEGTEEELDTATDLSDENIGHGVGFISCCPVCRCENILEY